MKNLRLPDEMLNVLYARGFTDGFKDKHGVKVVKKLGTFVTIRTDGKVRVANNSMAYEQVISSVRELHDALDFLQKIGMAVSEKVRVLGNQFLEYFAARHVRLVMKAERFGVYEFYTANTTNSVRLFWLSGERLSNSDDDVEIDFCSSSSNTGPILGIETFVDSLPTMYDAIRHRIDLTIQKSVVTLDCLDLFIPEMLERGLSDVVVLTYKTRTTTDVSILKSLVEQLPHSAEQTAYQIYFHDKAEA